MGHDLIVFVDFLHGQLVLLCASCTFSKTKNKNGCIVISTGIAASFLKVCNVYLLSSIRPTKIVNAMNCLVLPTSKKCIARINFLKKLEFGVQPKIRKIYEKLQGYVTLDIYGNTL